MVKNTLNVGSISEGFVLDHIEAGRSMDIYKYLHLDELDCCVAIIKNAKINKMGKKDIIKIDEVIDLDFDLIAYLAPSTTVNIIRNGKLEKMDKMEPPAYLKNVIKCKNPRCITSVEQELDHIFKLTDPQGPVYRCIYCETRAPKWSGQ